MGSKTPREKASEIYNMCLLYIASSDKFSAKACAIICINLIVEDASEQWGVGDDKYENSNHWAYWNDVKKAIEKI